MSQFPQLDEAFLKLKEQGMQDDEIYTNARAQGWTDLEIAAALSSLPQGSPEVMQAEVLPIKPPQLQKKKKGASRIVVWGVVALLCLGMIGFIVATKIYADYKVADASIMSALNVAKAQMEIYANSKEDGIDYTGGCDAVSFSRANVATYCNATEKSWVYAAELATGGYYCVDSTERRGEQYSGALISTGTQCP